MSALLARASQDNHEFWEPELPNVLYELYIIGAYEPTENTKSTSNNHYFDSYQYLVGSLCNKY